MYKLKISKLFKKQFKKLNNSDRELTMFVIDKLLANEKLEDKYKDHQLKGELKEFRDCHIRPDLVLIYQRIEKELIVYAFKIGSHNEVF